MDGIECTPEKVVDAECGDAILESICVNEKSEPLEDYYKDRPVEPCSDDEAPVAWAAIAHYAEENLEKAFEQIAELEKKVDMYQTGMFDEIEKRDKQLNKATKIIKALLRLWNDVMTEETVKALVAEAEQFLKEVGE